MKRIFYAIVALCLICVSCGKKNEFEVNGRLSDAGGKIVYLEQFGLNETKVIDSVKIAPNGSFEFEAACLGCPEFLRLRIDSALYLFAVDSTESVSINGTLSNLQNAELSGSKDAETLRILERRLLLADDSIRSLVEDFKAGKLTDRAALDSMVSVVLLNYKGEATKVIFDKQCYMASYYALYKKLIYGMEPFSANVSGDLRYFFFVANKWKKAYEGSARAAQLTGMAKELKERREQARKEQLYEKLDAEKSRGFVNLNLPDANGKIRSLYDLEGKTILLYFSNISVLSNYEILDLKDLRAKNPGLEIYMVSFDENVEQWKKAAKELPWICVNDLSGTSVLTYNIMQFPANFLIASNGTVVGRDVRVDDVRTFLKRGK